MSNALAIATVTCTIRYLLQRALESAPPGPVGGAQVSTLRLDQLGAGEVQPTPRLNVLLYQVTPNQAGNLDNLPTRTAAGAPVRRPSVALDLHYLLTGCGDETKLEGQRLLALGMLALATTPVLTRDTIAAAIEKYRQVAETAFLDASDLAEQPELVKLSPVPLTVEELTRLWGAFPQSPLQLSAAYRATVAVLEADVPTRRSLPVRARVLEVDAGVSVTLHAAESDAAGAAITAGSTIVLTGSGLLPASAAVTRVEIGGHALSVTAGTPQRLAVVVDDEVPAGVQGIRVRHVRPSPGPGVPERVVGSSNMLPVVICPTVAVGAKSVQTIRFEVHPRLRPGQRATVRLDRLDGAVDARAFALDPIPAGGAPLSTIGIPRAGISDGSWLVRYEVDGVSSLPGLVGEVYGTPRLDLP